MMRLATFTFLASASAVAPWNSTDMVRTKQQDVEKQGVIQKKVAHLEREASDADATLRNQETILNITRKGLSDANKSITGLLENEETAKKTLASMFETQKKAHEKMLKSAEASKEAYEKLKEAREALQHAQNATVAARAASIRSSDALDAAKDHLQQTVVQDPSNVIAAQADVDKKEEESKEAEEAFSKVQSSEEKAEAALKTAQQHSSQSWEAEKKAKQAMSEADAHVTAQEENLHEIQTAGQPKKVIISKLTEAVSRRIAIVKNFSAAAKAKHDALKAAIKEETDMKAEIERDYKCIEALQAKESAYSKKGAAWNTTKSAYAATIGVAQDEVHAHLKGVLWSVRDELAEATFELNQVQKECARGVKVPDMAPPAKPPTNTGGTCAFLDCDSNRHAECLVVDGSHRCMCKEGTYAKKGVCVDRGDPLQSSAVPAWRVSDLDNVRLAAAASALAAFGGAAAFALAKRSPPRQVIMPEDVLGW